MEAITGTAAGVPFQAADEFPAALAALRDQLPVDDEPIGVLGGSLGGAVALQIKAVALVNPAVRIRSVVPLVEDLAGKAYSWTAEAHRTADELDFVARARQVTAHPPLLLVSGELDHPALRADAADLVHALRERYGHSNKVELITVPGLAHPMADEPGLEPARQLPAARAVDEILTKWFLRQLTAR